MTTAKEYAQVSIEIKLNLERIETNSLGRKSVPNNCNNNLPCASPTAPPSPPPVILPSPVVDPSKPVN